jgi:hypothetical protein
MPENRFLRLEQNICRRSSLANVHSTTPPEEFWMGTIDRLPPVEIQPMESSNRVVSDAMSARGDWSIQSWDDGWPIELHYDSKSLRSQNGVMPATPTQLAAPAKPNGMRGNTPQSGGNAQPTAAVPCRSNLGGLRVGRGVRYANSLHALQHLLYNCRPSRLASTR